MRVNLTVHYDEHWDAKALGARWDPSHRTWWADEATLVANPGLRRWMPDKPRLQRQLAEAERWQQVHGKEVNSKVMGRTEPPGGFKPLCDCDVLPWEDCIHTYGREVNRSEWKHETGVAFK